MTSVVLVEDDPNLQLALRLRLAAAGYAVTQAMDAPSAMRRIVDVRPDVVVLDIALPGGSGLVVSERLRSNIHTADTPIVFTSGRPEGVDAKTLTELCATYLPKPFTFAQLADAMAASIARRNGHW